MTLEKYFLEIEENLFNLCFGLVSSMEYGGTRPFFHMVDRYFGNDSLEPFESKFMAQLALFNEGVRDHFPICGNFCEVLLVAGGFILFSLHMTMVWDLANGAGIPAPSDAIDV